MYSKILIPLGRIEDGRESPALRSLSRGKFKLPVELLAVVDIAEMARISSRRSPLPRYDD